MVTMRELNWGRLNFWRELWWNQYQHGSSEGRVWTSEGPYDTACFHAQQAVEKYLKGVLAWRGLEIPRTHVLEELQRNFLGCAFSLNRGSILRRVTSRT